MSKKSKKEWSLNPKEVSLGVIGSSSGKTGQFERKLKATSSTVSLTHEPTGIKVEGSVSSGHYSKKEMQQKKEALSESLFLKLETLVARRLKIKGR